MMMTTTTAVAATTDFASLQNPAFQIMLGGIGGGFVLAVIIIAAACVCKRRRDRADTDVVYGSALAGVQPQQTPVPVRAASLPHALAPSGEQFAQQYANQAPVVPDVAPPMQGNYGKLPDGPITASPDAAPDIYAEISNVALPGMPGSAPSLTNLPPPPPAAGYAPAPPRPDMLPPPL